MAVRIPVLPGGGVAPLDFTGIRALGNVGESFNRGRLTAERLQDIAEARADREEERSRDVARVAVLQDPRNDFTTAAGVRDVGARMLEAGLPQAGMTFLDRAMGMEDAALNRDLRRAQLANARAAGQRATETAATAAQNLENLRRLAPTVGLPAEAAGTGAVVAALKESVKTRTPLTTIGKINAAESSGELTPQQATKLRNEELQGEGVTTQAKNDARKADAAYRSVTSGLDQFENLIKKEGFASPGTSAARKYATQRRAIQLQLKELFNLGVLNGPDLELLNELLFDPTSAAAAGLNVGSKVGATTDATTAGVENIAQVRRMLKDIRDNAVRGVPGFDDAQTANTGTSGGDLAGMKDRYGLE